METGDSPEDNGEPKVVYKGPGYARIPQEGEVVVENAGQKTKKRGKADTLKVLLPFRPKKNKTRSAMDTSGLFSTVLFSFMTSIYWKAHRKGIDQDTLLPLMSDREAAAVNCDRLERLWQEELAKSGGSDAALKKAILKFVRTRFIMSSMAIVLASSCGSLLTAYLLFLAISYLENTESSVGYCLTLSFSIFIATVVRLVGGSFSNYLNCRSAVRLRSAAMMLLYRKVTRLRTTSKVSVGEMVNICVNDIQRMHDAIIFGPMLFSFPLFIVFIVAGVVMVIGVVPTVVGVLTLTFFFAIQTCLARINVRIRQKCVVFTDRRTRLMNEVLNCIKLIKMYAWENPFARKLEDIRKREKKYLTQAGFLQSFAVGLSVTIGTATVLTSIISYSLLGNIVTAARAFTLLQLYGSLTGTLFVLPLALKPISESIVAIKRIQPILLMDETCHEWDPPTDPGHAIEIVNASLSWDDPPAAEQGSAGPNISDKPSTKYKPVDQDGDLEERDKEKGTDEDEKPAAVSDGLLENGPASQGLPLTLKNIHLVVPRSHLIGICGSVGSGKSSLLSSLLDQLNLVEGKIALRGSFAYAAQQAWITNASVRDNILFGEPHNEERYRKAIFSCCLERDLEIMSDGDRTEIGERGVNVSGGQKQRISLARAYYSDRDIYLLDDPLSAVDAHVGKHIFTHCINGVLKGKTVLFVTHQLQYLSDCDYVVLMRNGTISEQGTHEELISAKKEYARLIDTFHGTQGGEEEDVNEVIPPKVEEEPQNEEESQDEITEHKGEKDGQAQREEATEVVKLIGDEDKGHGTVAYATYQSFVRFTGGKIWAFLVPLLMFLTMAISIATNIWLSIWIQSATTWRNYSQSATEESPIATTYSWLSTSTPLVNYSVDDVINETLDDSYDYGRDDENAMTTSSPLGNQSDDHPTAAEGIVFFISIYAGLFFLTYACIIISSIVFIVTVLRANTRIHDSLLRKIMRCPMSFFDTTPLGRILNRFSKDMDEVDLLLPINLQRCLFFLSVLLVTQAFFVFVFPLYIIAFFIVLIIGGVIYVIFRKGYCEIKRMDNTSRSKVVSHISATMQGLTTIKAYGQGRRFTSTFETLLDTNSLIMELFFMAPRWTSARLDLLSSCLLLVLASLILVFKESLFSAAIAAMALQQALSISGGLLQEIILSCTQTESSFLSVERMLEYIEESPSEADAHIEATKPDDKWPQHGDLKMQQLAMRYRPNLPLVLKGISCHIQPKEKIGIVGRTGSGKSTLGVSLFRIVESASGGIILDDIDISTIGLDDLRSKLSIIPQDPVLFAGTVRFNLDPLDNHTDEELWTALEKTYVKQTISNLENQLEAPVIENGENFSVGERQLMCMARALLRNSKVLLMDEATAAIDTETDSLIQQTIREAFKDCTMLIIAHRLNTILDCDKIMLMDNGKIAEFDKPEALKANPNSLFSGMLAASKHNTGSLED